VDVLFLLIFFSGAFCKRLIIGIGRTGGREGVGVVDLGVILDLDGLGYYPLLLQSALCLREDLRNYFLPACLLLKVLNGWLPASSRVTQNRRGDYFAAGIHEDRLLLLLLLLELRLCLEMDLRLLLLELRLRWLSINY
jgi:hypothetical protein